MFILRKHMLTCLYLYLYVVESLLSYETTGERAQLVAHCKLISQKQHIPTLNNIVL
jgi:hypothetical protein